MAELGATAVRPKRADEPGQGPHPAPIRQRIESVFWTCTVLPTWSAKAPVPWSGCVNAS